ncbi:MAG: diiron oxygenase [Thermoanaerobaculia bacterium]
MAKPAIPLLEDVSVDTGRPFIPAEITPLFHTPCYRDLTEAQRLRYNQLHALYFNEQISFFETALGQPVLSALLREPWPEGLAEGLRQFQEEERQHTEMFRRLNRLCAPRLYESADLHFVRVPAFWTRVMRWAVSHPLSLPLFLWLMLLQEERSLYYSRAYLRSSEPLEPLFVETHRHHMADEARHVRWDEELLDALWLRASSPLRAVNARLFAWMLEEFFGAPKRAQLSVIEELAREVPEIRGRLPEMRRQMLALGRDEAYRETLYSRDIVPRTFARFDQCPEFRTLSLCGYFPQEREAR